jgi:hypothetical protein
VSSGQRDNHQTSFEGDHLPLESVKNSDGFGATERWWPCPRANHSDAREGPWPSIGLLLKNRLRKIAKTCAKTR